MFYMLDCGIECNTFCCRSDRNKFIQATEESSSKGFYSLQLFVICGLNERLQQNKMLRCKETEDALLWSSDLGKTP